jgi:hypothetical protein
MLMKLTPVVNLIYVIRATIAHENPKSTKRQSSHISVFLYFLDLHLQKAAHKMLVKLTPGMLIEQDVSVRNSTKLYHIF